MSGIKFVKWQQCSISGNEAICPWKTQISQVYQNLEVKTNAEISSELFWFTFTLLKYL